MQVFAENPWFGSLPDAVAEALMCAARPRKLGQGEFLYHQGDSIDEPFGAFFGVTKGLIKLSIHHQDGNEAIIAVVEPGNWFGEVALLDPFPRAHTAAALEDTELLSVSADTFNVLMSHNAFAQAIARLVAVRLRLAYGLLADSALQSTRERVRRRLVLLAHGDVTQSRSGRSSVTTSQDNLAMMLGISRPTLNKELQALAKLGAITLRYGRIEIRDMQLLTGGGRPPLEP
ncbi:transcriptional regulator [Caballeronia arationis]|jgi:CRP-like cAMP-binding protein|uniref:cAMP-binding domain of CRP or a regulatory subunit of cAMP-dependent protein kinases n=1 Tax=Caballeronia arationis TaxID=1777142 RepID=A0A7Z7N0G2_9BURK|nr:Crp/Fnr family transcriptional regulator [Caballeronia arationis]SAL05394.1 transcriptional regulator [Caballeronia arationis]SOE53762.1 cAMP-binding domain of CRP or a regulatory subunit of cAMP-dependent protein kinases [Caballeronia arationis]